MTTVVLILSIIVGIVLWVIYHQLFKVAYFKFYCNDSRIFHLHSNWVLHSVTCDWIFR